jgi:hypothetical protein
MRRGCKIITFPETVDKSSGGRRVVLPAPGVAVKIKFADSRIALTIEGISGSIGKGAKDMTPTLSRLYLESIPGIEYKNNPRVR